MFEIPANSFISIHLRNGEAFWTHKKIYDVDLKKIGLVKTPNHEGDIIAMIKTLLI